METKREKGRLRRWLVTACAAVLLILLYGAIFGFSAQDGEQSGSLSQHISFRCVEALNVLSCAGWSQDKVAEMAEAFEHPIRKMAHFGEYACMGVLVYVLWSQWMERGRRLYLLTAAWVFLSAAGDEFHQYFVPGRCASFADVLLDTSGGIAGMLFCLCVAALCRRRRKGHSRISAR